MKIKLIVVGEKMPKWVKEACGEYSKRLLSSDLKIQIIEIPTAKRSKAISKAKLLNQEYKMILDKVDQSDYMIILDPKGDNVSTEEMAKKIDRWKSSNPKLSIIIGGPDGIDDELKRMANEKIALSKMTFPHPIARLIILEQIYRCSSILSGHPYHK